MQITTQVSVGGDHTALRSMIQDFNKSCNWLSEIAFSEQLFHWLSLQRRAYHEVCAHFGLTSAQAVVAIRKVTASYKNKMRRNTLATFHLLGAIPLYRHRYKRDGAVLLYGHRYPFIARPGVALSSKHEATLIYRDSRFFIHQVIDVPEGEPLATQGFLGCDLGIVNILADSDGETYSGGQVNGLRKRHARLRAKLQSKGTRSAKRLLRKRRMKEARFARAVNHRISKQVVTKAHDTFRGIALEDLGGIQERINVRRAQRRQHHSWAFLQLRQFIEYKAALAGVPCVAVDPHNTSRTCPRCGVIDKANRRTQARFFCIGCGYAAQADVLAAGNIAHRASVSRGFGDSPNAASYLAG